MPVCSTKRPRGMTHAALITGALARHEIVTITLGLKLPAPCLWTIRRICGSRPMPSMLSTSSKTKCLDKAGTHTINTTERACE
jgi:hypothetical protein